jgi:hypothetical protein
MYKPILKHVFGIFLKKALFISASCPEVPTFHYNQLKNIPKHANKGIFPVKLGSYFVQFQLNYKRTLKKKLTHFATKPSEIIISSRTADSTLQNRSLLYKTQIN